MKTTLLTFLFCILTSTGLQAQNWDANIASQISRWPIHDLSKGLSYSELILPVAIPAAMGIYGLIKKDQPLLKNTIYIGTTIIEASLITYSMKYIFNRQRPYVKYPDKIHLVGHAEDDPSFPSGHTAVAFSLATSLSIFYPKWYVIAPSAVWACSVGLARINQGVHYPSDVLAGAAIGIGCGFLNIYVNKWLNKVLFK